MITQILIQDCKWSPYHSEWGYASGRAHTIQFNTALECQDWIDNNIPSSGSYKVLPLLRGQELSKAIVIENYYE